MFNWLRRQKPVQDAASETNVKGKDYLFTAANEIAQAYFDYLSIIDPNDLYAELDEMEEGLPELEAALDTIADTATQGERGDEFSFSVKAANQELVDELNSLYNRLNMHDEIWGIARDMVKYGNEFDLIYKDNGIITELETLPIYVMRRRYISGRNKPKDMFYRVDYDDTDTILQNYAYDDVIHWRWKVPRSGFMRDGEYFSPLYGRGLGFSFLKTYKKLLLMEDSLILGRLTRAIAKIVYKLDVGNMPPSKAEEYVKQKKKELGRRKYIDAATGYLSSTTNPLQDEDDIFLEVRPNSGTDVKALNLQQTSQWVGDVSYIQNKLFCALRTPKGYLNYEKDLNARATLLKQDVQFGRWIKRLQSALTYGIKDLGYRQLELGKQNYKGKVDYFTKQALFILRDKYSITQISKLRGVHRELRDTEFLMKRIHEDTQLGDTEIEKAAMLIDKAASFQEMSDIDVDFDIVFPAVSTDDELTKAQVEATRSKVAVVMASLGLMGRKDVLVEVFNYTEEEAEELINAANQDFADLPTTKKKEVKDAAQAVFNSVMTDLNSVLMSDEKFLRDTYKPDDELTTD